MRACDCFPNLLRQRVLYYLQSQNYVLVRCIGENPVLVRYYGRESSPTPGDYFLLILYLELSGFKKLSKLLNLYHYFSKPERLWGFSKLFPNKAKLKKLLMLWRYVE